MPRLSRRTWTALLGLAALAVLLIVLGRLAPAGSAGTAAPAGPSPSASSAGPFSAPASAGGTSGRSTSAGPSPARSDGLPPGVPSKVLAVLRVVDETGQPPQGYVGGRQFLNDGRGGTSLLPRRSADGVPIEYHEYDVNPRRSGVNRGPQRLVLGDDGSAYYTGDHYETWVRIR